LCFELRGGSILQAFASAQRVTLQWLTIFDITKLLCSRLIERAEGAFLWLVLLLKWIDDELTVGTTSFGALRRLVETAPRELDDFFRSMLEGIPKHHSRRAYFIFAIMLRVHGFCIDRDFCQDKGDLENKLGGLVEPSIFGLSYIFDAFENASRYGNIRITLLVLPCANTSEYRVRESQTVSTLQSWCKDLAEVRKTDGRQVANALQEFAPKYNMDDT
jgi:hypothetical protein